MAARDRVAGSFQLESVERTRVIGASWLSAPPAGSIDSTSFGGKRSRIMDRAGLVELISKHAMDEHQDFILGIARPSVNILVGDPDPPAGSSKFGGAPIFSRTSRGPLTPPDCTSSSPSSDCRIRPSRVSGSRLIGCCHSSVVPPRTDTRSTTRARTSSERSTSRARPASGHIRHRLPSIAAHVGP